MTALANARVKRKLAGKEGTDTGKAKVGRKSKSHDEACSRAMSSWKSTGHQTPEVAKTLALCRTKAKGKSLGATAEKQAPGKSAVELVSRKARDQVKAKSEERAVNTPDAIEKSKYIGEKVGDAERRYADLQEQRVARMVGGTWLSDKEPADVERHSRAGLSHLFEVKTAMVGSKQNMSLKDDALVRKVKRAADLGNARWHSVVIDHRDRFNGGAAGEHHSGHDLYYRRGLGPYSYNSMYKVKNQAELRRLVDMPDDELPLKARGTIPDAARMEVVRRNAAKVKDGRHRRKLTWRARQRAAKAETIRATE